MSPLNKTQLRTAHFHSTLISEQITDSHTHLKGQQCRTCYRLDLCFLLSSPLLCSGWPVLSEVLDEGICLEGGWGTALHMCVCVCIWVSHWDLFSGILTGTDAPSGFKGNSKRASDRRPIPSVCVCVCVCVRFAHYVREGGPAGQHKYWQRDQPIKWDPPRSTQPTQEHDATQSPASSADLCKWEYWLILLCMLGNCSINWLSVTTNSEEMHTHTISPWHAIKACPINKKRWRKQ